MIPPMRHRLFHAVVLMGASLPACGSDEAAPVADSAIASDTGGAVVDSTTAGDSNAGDSNAGDSTAGDTAKGDSTVVDTAKGDAPVDTCVDEGCGCFPCIK